MKTGTTPSSKKEEYYGGDMPWFCPGDLGESKLLLQSSRKITQKAIDDRKARVFEGGTVLLVTIGATLGKVGLAPKTVSSNQQITGLLFNNSIVPDYAYWWLRSQYDNLRHTAPAATLPILNQQTLGSMPIAVPPLDEQRHIVAYLDGLQVKVEALRRLQDETQAELDAMTPPC
jgi:type I restriction enzyme S subunit